MTLNVAFCTLDAARFAVKAWHYSRSMPAGRLVLIGAWEGGAFIGAVVFGRGASSHIHSPFGLQQSAVCELCRVALAPHTTPTSRIVAAAVRLLQQQSPQLRLIVSYADPEHGHVGTLYQAMNWFYLGQTNAESLIVVNGKPTHPRTVASRYGTRSIAWLKAHVAADASHARTLPKHRYVLPLDRAMRRQLQTRRQPNPKSCEQSVESGTPRSLPFGRDGASTSARLPGRGAAHA